MAVPGLGTSLIYAHGNSWDWATCERGWALITTARRSSSSRLEIGGTALLGLHNAEVAVQDTNRQREKGKQNKRERKKQRLMRGTESALLKLTFLIAKFTVPADASTGRNVWRHATFEAHRTILRFNDVKLTTRNTPYNFPSRIC